MSPRRRATLSGIGSINLNVAVVDSDFYARNAINAYLAWDRRTRVICKTARLGDFWSALAEGRLKDEPDVVIVDASQFAGAAPLAQAVGDLRGRFKSLMVICLAPFADLDDLYAATEAGAKAYLLKPDTRIHIAWALCHAHCLPADDFLISPGVVREARKLSHRRLSPARQLAGPRRYQNMSRRGFEALALYAVEGMSHRLVAHEMGISENTARSYIRDAKKILEAYHDDAGDYPDDMSAQEIAFMRITALDIPDFQLSQRPR